VVAGGLADILHAGVVVAAHGQRLREDHAGRAPRARVARRARDATAGLAVTRLADGSGNVSFAGATYGAGRRWARAPVDVTIVAGPVQLSRDGKIIRVTGLPRERKPVDDRSLVTTFGHGRSALGVRSHFQAESKAALSAGKSVALLTCHLQIR
jgi:hypothetical protein